MSVTFDNGVRAEVAAPTPVPYRFGIFSVATPLPEGDGRWEGGGMEWVSEACVTPAFTNNECVDPSAPELVAQGMCVIMSYDPFTVYAVNNDSAGKTRDLTEAANIARARLEASEQFGVEEKLWALLTPTTEVAATSPAMGLALVEQMLTESYPSMGVVHMSRLTATLLGELGIVHAEGNRLVTTLGTPVVAGGGYGQVNGVEPTDAAIYGTGPLVLLRGTVDTVRGFNRDVNSHYTIAQRPYAVGWDCSVVGATFTV